MNTFFAHLARRISNALGSVWAFLFAVTVVLAWAISGPFLGFSNNWQLTINTGTTIVTFLMVFLIQNTQNRDSQALHLKLDELVMSMRGARNSLVDVEEATDEQIAKLKEQYHKIGAHEQEEAIDRVAEARRRPASRTATQPSNAHSRTNGHARSGAAKSVDNRPDESAGRRAPGDSKATGGGSRRRPSTRRSG